MAEEASKDDYSRRSGPTGTRSPSLEETEQSICTGRKFARIHNTVSECMSCRAGGYCASAGQPRTVTQTTSELSSARSTRKHSIRAAQQDRHFRRHVKTARTVRNQDWKMRRRMLHRGGQAQASQCSSDRGMSNEGFVMVKVSVLRGPGLHEIAVILPRSCGRVFRACSSPFQARCCEAVEG